MDFWIRVWKLQTNSVWPARLSCKNRPVAGAAYPLVRRTAAGDRAPLRAGPGGPGGTTAQSASALHVEEVHPLAGRGGEGAAGG